MSCDKMSNFVWNATLQVPMRGRGAVPTPASVNQVFWMAYCFKANPENRDKFIVIHCTHGFNRTGKTLRCHTIVTTGSYMLVLHAVTSKIP